MMRYALLIAALALTSLGSADHADAQLREQRWLLETRNSPVILQHVAPEPAEIGVDVGSARRLVAIHPLLRTIAIVAASTGGYYLADQNLDGDLIDSDSDVRYEPLAVGAGAGALTGIVFSTANPLRVIAGAALATLPAAALSTFIEGNLEEGESENLPAISFGAIHGLLTSAFAQNR